ncbi:unnamed protein product [Ixodes pacificus]
MYLRCICLKAPRATAISYATAFLHLFQSLRALSVSVVLEHCICCKEISKFWKEFGSYRVTHKVYKLFLLFLGKCIQYILTCLIILWPPINHVYSGIWPLIELFYVPLYRAVFFSCTKFLHKGGSYMNVVFTVFIWLNGSITIAIIRLIN